ncbi:hypothetical protein LSAT2_010312, partial [Lamellibrachia satsuma]
IQKATRAKAADDALMQEESPSVVTSPPVLSPSVDPVLHATLMTVISTQIAQGFKNLQAESEAIPSTSAALAMDIGGQRKRGPSPVSDDSNDSDCHLDTDRAEATFERRARKNSMQRKK